MNDFDKASEYHRGYADGLAARDLRTYQLDEDRREVAARLREIPFRENGSHANLSQVFAAIMGCPFAWNVAACQRVVRRLVWLLTGEGEE